MLRRGDWTGFVHQPMIESEVASIRHSIKRGRPFGSKSWIREMAERLGLEFSLRPPKGQAASTSPSQNT